jgi:uridine kinase
MPGPKPYIIGICGGSASGKTFLLNQLLNQFTEEQVTLVSQDNYYRPLEDQHRDEEGLVNFDHPDSVDLDKLHADLKALMEGKTLHIKEYTFNNPKIHARTLELRPNPIIILEGLFVYYRQDLAQLIDLKVFVEADEHVKLTRRLRRDHTERGYTIESILRDYDKFVAPMYHRFVAPSKQIADLIVLNNRRMYKAIQVLIHHLHAILAEKT